MSIRSELPMARELPASMLLAQVAAPVGGPSSASGPQLRLLGSAFGINLAGAVPLRIPLAQPLAGGQRLALHRRGAPSAFDPRSLHRSFASSALRPDGGPRFEVFRGAEGELLRFHGWADHWLQADRVESYPDPTEPAADSVLELHWLGMVMAYRQEALGRPVLHASVVSAEGRGLAFLAGSAGGKTTLAAALMDQGCDLVSDDLLVARASGEGIEALPAYPCLRVGPELAERHAGAAADLAPVHLGSAKRLLPVGPGGFGRFAAEACTLSAIFLPERVAAGAPRIERVPPAEALIALLGGSFLPWAGQALDRSAERLAALAEIAQRVPLFRLQLADDLDGLPILAQDILDTIDSHPASRLGPMHHRGIR